MSTQSRSVPVRRGAPLFPARRAHLLTTRYAGGGTACGSRALSEGDCSFCGKRPPMPEGIGGATGEVAPAPSPVASENLPPAAFRCYGGRRTMDGRRRMEVIKTGNLSSGGKGYQPGDRPLRCCSSGLHELFSDVQRL